MDPRSGTRHRNPHCCAGGGSGGCHRPMPRTRSSPVTWPRSDANSQWSSRSCPVIRPGPSFAPPQVTNIRQRRLLGYHLGQGLVVDGDGFDGRQWPRMWTKTWRAGPRTRFDVRWWCWEIAWNVASGHRHRPRL